MKLFQYGGWMHLFLEKEVWVQKDLMGVNVPVDVLWEKRMQIIENRRHKVMCQTVPETKEASGNVWEYLEKSWMIIQKREGGAAAKLWEKRFLFDVEVWSYSGKYCTISKNVHAFIEEK